MVFQAKNGSVDIGGAQMEYLRFGTGKGVLVMLPGLGDSLRSMKGMALPMALLYRCFAKDFTVYVFGRKSGLAQGYTTRDMARDQAETMEMLGISKADIFGVSMGGMIAQYLAIDYPEKVGKLVLAVTSSEPNAIMEESIGEWVALARDGNHTAFMESNLRRIYSERYYRKNKWMVPILGKLTKPSSYDSFFIQADACLAHNTTDILSAIAAPALVIGGERDLTLGGEPSRHIAGAIPNARLKMYPQWGHGLYEEAKDFNRVVLDFLKD